MNAISYLRLLRPVRSLLAALIYSVMGSVLLGVFIHLNRSQLQFGGLTLIAPFLMGCLLVGPMHEVLHLETSGLLPGLRRGLAKGYASGLIGCLLLLLVAGRLILPELPAAAAIGWALLGLSLPLFNRRRRHFRGIRLGFFPPLLLALLLIYAFCMPFLMRTSLAHPWLILLAGLPFPLLGIQRLLDQREHQARLGDPVVCFQTSLLFNKNIIDGSLRAEARRRANAGRGELRARTFKANDGSDAAWRRTLGILRMPARLPYWAVIILTSALGSLGVLVFFPIIGFCSDRQEIITVLQALLAPLQSAEDLRRFGTDLSRTMIVLWSMGMMILLSHSLVYGLHVNRIYLPLSRQRLARLHYTGILFSTITSCLAFFGMLILGVRALAWMLGVPFHLNTNSLILVEVEHTVPAIALSLIFKNTRLPRLSAGILSLIVLCGCCGWFLALGAGAVPPLGFSALLLLTTCAWGVLWWVNRDRFLHGDLNLAKGMMVELF